MENLGLWLSLATGLALALWLGPSAFRVNQGHVLRTIAIWLAIFVALGWFYHLFGPFGTVAEQRLQRPETAAPNADGSEDSAPMGDEYSPPQDSDQPTIKPL